MSTMATISGATLRTLTSNPRRSVSCEAAHPWHPPLVRNGEVSVLHIDNGNLPAVGRDGTIYLHVQKFLNDRAKLGVGAPRRTCRARGREDGRSPRDEVRTDDRSDCRFQRGPGGPRMSASSSPTR